MKSHDAIVVGGGLVGSAVAFGLAEKGLHVAVLDEGDVAFRASRGNFGLVWVQSKGDGMQAYAEWTGRSADLWPGFADTLSGELGVDIGYRKPGGLHLCLSEKELEDRKALLHRMHNQAGEGGYDCRVLDRAEVADMVPGIGEAVVGATYGPHDGHANPLYLLRALHNGLSLRGADYRPNARVERIARDGSAYAVHTATERLVAPKVVLAAGLGSRRLGPDIGLDVPVAPLKGQILVTERCPQRFAMPTAFVRQTEEGSYLLGDSHEDVGFDVTSSVDVIGQIAARAVRSFPFLNDVRVVRGWGALRIMTPDGFPVYDESETHPGAYSVSCHSGVTLAAAHALGLAPAIADDRFRETFAAFTARRFDVSQA
ncbi:FAD-binding oxidoreductase [Kaustia mangrovi]|uniref:FAD-binding oxidoreductase n=1 Tax=Kaustia mangrovi TaxID=2593653 RepID=A0A7S8C3P3_9HYPH|nr:FAD-dependent oxidoreductase [Kaustia mangrovi]QPC42789.1 FAD-binding oxidoreductase [Kaustia mangrovi]